MRGSFRSGSYVDANLSTSQSDLLFGVTIAGRPGFIYVLFEHQSTVDELMPFRVLKYVVRILDECLVGTPSGRRAPPPLPAVIPLVLHHSASGWTASTRMDELFDASVSEDATIRPYLPRISFVLDDISHVTDEELKARALGLLPTLALWALRDARKPGKIEKNLLRWTAIIRDLARSESGAEALLMIFRYLSVVANDLSPHTLAATLALAAPETKDALMTTLAERWKDEGRTEGRLEGRTEGRLEGRTEGRLEGARTLLLNLLELKFGQLGEAERSLIATANEDRLVEWSKRVLNAATITDVLGDC